MSFCSTIVFGGQVPHKATSSMFRVSGLSDKSIEESHAGGIGNTQQSDVCVWPLVWLSLVDIIPVVAVLLCVRRPRKITEDPGRPPSAALYAVSLAPSRWSSAVWWTHLGLLSVFGKSGICSNCISGAVGQLMANNHAHKRFWKTDWDSAS